MVASQPGEIQAQRVAPGTLTRMRVHAELEHFHPLEVAVEAELPAGRRPVAMGVSVVSLAVGPRIETHTARASFERALNESKCRS